MNFFSKAQNLQAREFSGTADPYAKIRLLPDKAVTYQTKIHKKTLNPGKFNFTLTSFSSIFFL